jgi:hypothetical protein
VGNGKGHLCMTDFRNLDFSNKKNLRTNTPPSRSSRFLVSTAICALVASGVLTAIAEPAGAQEPYDEDLITYHTGALSLGKTDGVDANLDNSKDINLTEIRVGTAMGAHAISVYAHGSQTLHKPGGPAGNITIKQSGDLTSSNLADDTIASTSSVLRAISVGGEGNEADHRDKRKAGNGGSGGDITITNSGTIVSDVEQTYAIHAISYGGIGGYQDPESSKYPAGLGGKGGRVTLINSNNVTSNRSDAAAIVLQSLGGPSGRDEIQQRSEKRRQAASLTLKSQTSGKPIGHLHKGRPLGGYCCAKRRRRVTSPTISPTGRRGPSAAETAVLLISILVETRSLQAAISLMASSARASAVRPACLQRARPDPTVGMHQQSA